MRSRRSISCRTFTIVARANAASGCQRVSSESAPRTSPFQLCNWVFGAVARTPAISNGSPATAAAMRNTRRRVKRASARETSLVSFTSGICHLHAERLRLAAQLRGGDQRRTPLVVIIFNLAIEALEALAGDDLACRHDRQPG